MCIWHQPLFDAYASGRHLGSFIMVSQAQNYINRINEPAEVLNRCHPPKRLAVNEAWRKQKKQK